MEKTSTMFKDCWLLKPTVFKDQRGFFLESYSLRSFTECGISTMFVQDNFSFSENCGVLRGLHFQLPPFAQTKLIRVVRGAIYDVVVDLRKNSPTFRTWQCFELTGDDFSLLYIPQGFAHGFCTLKEKTEVMYKTDVFYEPKFDGGIRWNDPTLAIEWPMKNPILSTKDGALPYLKDFDSPF
ncbi:MAG: dTDP-4-dehydrorhamnose 3,5-epimerase [Chitinivibrionales bacterium]|nr:dTDP-4-dehydrorhamnose 3,5-epimerase [Chitinivibrionales bacterium]